MTTTVLIPADDFEQVAFDLSSDAFHHLFRVRRLRVGDRLRVVDGDGRARAATVERVERDSARLRLGDGLATNEAELEVELIVTSPRPQRAAWLVEKATEVGVVAVRFINTSRGPRRYGSSTVRRLERMARSAVEQAGRSRVPEITAGHAWTDVSSLIDPLGKCWVLDPAAPITPLAPPSRSARVGIVIGPEGGFKAEELAFLTRRGCLAAGLGERILRIETAAVVAAGLLLVTPSVDTV